jgi:tRNA dimethylallyltransferase
MKKLLYIIGPTATGKTNLALSLAHKFNGDIVSADSRQVYRGMDIGTGKDIPPGFKKVIKKENHHQTIVYQKDHIKIWGYDLVNPDQEFSIAHFQKFAHSTINQIHNQGKLPIIVGGSGLYANCIQNPPKSLSIPQNPKLRKKLNTLSIEELKNKLNNLNHKKYSSMNQSDVNNPRRLIRAIEIHSFKKDNLSQIADKKNFDSLWIGLDFPLIKIDKAIEDRVKARIKAGFETEFESLYKSGLININFQSSSSTGYRQWLEYKNNQISKNQAITKWITAEKQYVRRQLTWFKKNKQINWYNPNTTSFIKSVEQLVRVWYS